MGRSSEQLNRESFAVWQTKYRQLLSSFLTDCKVSWQRSLIFLIAVFRLITFKFVPSKREMNDCLSITFIADIESVMKYKSFLSKSSWFGKHLFRNVSVIFYCIFCFLLLVLLLSADISREYFLFEFISWLDKLSFSFFYFLWPS